MHHGTLLFDSNLSALSDALNVDPAKIKAKGVRSVRSHVTTIHSHLSHSISLADFKSLLLKHLFPSGVEQYSLTAEDIAAIEELRVRRYDTWNWNYGSSPACSLIRKQRFEGCGTIEAHIQLEQGGIAAINFHGDFFSAIGPEALAETLIGLRLTTEDCLPILESANIPEMFIGASPRDLLSLLCPS